MSCLLSCPISLVSLYGDVSLRSVGLSVSSVKCIAIYCSVTAECWDESIKCQVSHVLSHNMCLVMSHSMCCVNTDVSLLRVKCQVSAECRVECIKCQVSCPIICFFCVTVLGCVSAECRVESDECPA